MDKSSEHLFFKLIDQSISTEEFEALQEAIEKDDRVRERYLQAVRLTATLENIAVDGPPQKITTQKAPADGSAVQGRIWQIAGIVVVALFVAAAAYFIGHNDRRSDVDSVTKAAGSEDAEFLLSGHASLRRAIGVEWSPGQTEYRVGDILPDGQLQFRKGLAEIDFFCGATLIVEGPASFDIESDWAVSLREGRLRASVPPAAQGFVVRAAGSDIVDLGTEFALEVEGDNARIEVVDGEVRIDKGDHDGSVLRTGDRQWIKGSAKASAVSGLMTRLDLRDQQLGVHRRRFDAWQKSSRRLMLDKRLAAYYPIAGNTDRRFVTNEAVHGKASDAKMVGPTEIAAGRFADLSAGLNFSRPGSRVRTRIDGKFSALSLVCWVRIDSLDHAYNALFMSDGYENGEVHWQIRSDGCVMISVMVDETETQTHFSKVEQATVTTAGLARVYDTEPIWDVSKSGQWMHLAAVYDPANRQVRQYVNGELAGADEITDRFYIDTLRIGAAEIGNWGQPFRKTPAFAVRNLNGTVDELAVFRAALHPEEIRSLYEDGRPAGY